MILHSPFDIQTHKKHFINYLEVIIRADGTVEYAVPSHQEKLIEIAMNQYGYKSRDEFIEFARKQGLIDFSQWLCDITGCVSVWNAWSIYPRVVTKEQKDTLNKLKEEELYCGNC